MVKITTIITALLALTALGACTGSEVRQSMGMKRNNPDEFQVVSRPPLSVPPVYFLRPPSDEGVGMTPADSRAEALVFEGKELPAYQLPDHDGMQRAETAVPEVRSSALDSEAESVLLRNAGATQANPQIRDLLKEDNTVYVEVQEEKKGFMYKLKNGLIPSAEGEDPVVDAAGEQQRIRRNQQEQRSITIGETPVLDPKQESVLDKIF
jgi:hypothetical protein